MRKNIIMWQKFKQYILNNLISLDQSLNAATGGDPQETISSRLGKIYYTSKFARFLCKIISWFLGKDHCTKNIEPDVGQNAVLK